MILTNRGVMDEAGEQFVAYFLPTEETMAKRRSDQDEGKDYTDDAEYEYKMARLEGVKLYFEALIVYRLSCREYNWNVKSKASKGYEENFFFLFRSDLIE